MPRFWHDTEFPLQSFTSIISAIKQWSLLSLREQTFMKIFLHMLLLTIILSLISSETHFQKKIRITFYKGNKVMKDMTPISKLITVVPERPETTISLIQALQRADSTVRTYFFTPTIEEVFEKILDAVASGQGCGYWVQAEYGAGKTHFLAALSCLLLDTSESLWNLIKNDSVKNCRHRLIDKRLFPVILSLKGQAGVDKSDNLLHIIFESISEELEKRGLTEKISITTEDELLSWYEDRPDDLKSLINTYIRKESGRETVSLDNKRAASLISSYCRKHFGGLPQVSGTTKKRIHHIYHQIVQLGFSGLFFVIDEFETWQRRHAVGTAESALDEEVLETLSCGYCQKTWAWLCTLSWRHRWKLLQNSGATDLSTYIFWLRNRTMILLWLKE